MSFTLSNDIDPDPPESPPPIPEPEDDPPNTNQDFLTIRRRCELCKQRKVRRRTARQVFATFNTKPIYLWKQFEASE
jgi:hypothetical protein